MKLFLIDRSNTGANNNLSELENECRSEIVMFVRLGHVNKLNDRQPNEKKS